MCVLSFDFLGGGDVFHIIETEVNDFHFLFVFLI